MTQGWKFGSRTHRPQDPTLLAIFGAEAVSALSCKLRPRSGKFLNAIIDTVVGEVRPVSAKGIGLYTVNPSLEVGIVDIDDNVWSGDVENLITALVTLKVFEGGLALLKHGSHGSVCNYNALRERFEQAGTALGERYLFPFMQMQVSSKEIGGLRRLAISEKPTPFGVTKALEGIRCL